MIRLLAAWTRITVVAVSMAMSIPAITFAQTPESATESEPAAGDNASPVQAASGPEDNTSVETNPPARSTIPSEIEVERQSRFNDLRREVLDARAKLVDWWLAATAIFLTLLGIVAVIAGYLSFKRFREIEAEARQNVTASQQYTEEARHLVEEIKAKRHEAESLMEGLNAQIASDDPGKATQAILSVRQNPEASLTDKAISDAVSLQQQGKRDAAIEKWRAIAHVVEGSDNDLAARAWFSVGYLALDEDPKGSVLANDRAIRLKPDLDGAYINRGNARQKLEQYEAAIADYDEAIRQKPDCAETYSNRSVAKQKLGQYEAAIADCNEAIRLKPDYAGAYINRSGTKQKLGQYEAAIADCNEAIHLNPTLVEAYSNRGVAKAGLGQYDAAVADYDEAIRLKPDYAEAYINRSGTKQKLGQYEAAIADCNEAIHLNPTLVEAYSNRGVAKAGLGQYDAAVADYDEAIRLKPDYAEAYINRGAAKYELGRHEAAVADYNEAIRLKPACAEAYSNRGEANQKLGQYEDAVDDCNEAIRLKPDYAEAYINRGAAKVALVLKDAARKDFEIALELARKANDAKIVAQAEQLLRDLDAAEGS